MLQRIIGPNAEHAPVLYLIMKFRILWAMSGWSGSQISASPTPSSCHGAWFQKPAHSSTQTCAYPDSSSPTGASIENTCDYDESENDGMLGSAKKRARMDN